MLKNPRYQAFVGGSSWSSRGTCLDFADVRRFLQCYLRCNIFRVDKPLFNKYVGCQWVVALPLFALVLGGCEATWREN